MAVDALNYMYDLIRDEDEVEINGNLIPIYNMTMSESLISSKDP